MAKHKKKKTNDTKAEIAKWVAIGAWAAPASGVVSIAHMVIKHLLR